MELLVIRHGIAMERDEFAPTGQSDDLRPLTDEGREKMKRNAAGLAALVPKIDLLATSPLLRARQTAEIVAGAYGEPVADVTDVLVPDAAFDDFVAWLAERQRKGVVAVVGHEPHLSGLVTWLLTGFDDSRIALKKGGACLLQFDAKPRRAGATLQWLATPKQLARLGA